MESYINVFSKLPDEDAYPIMDMIWKALEKQGLDFGQDAEMSIRIYDDNFEGEYDGEEYDS
tara:strand:- start:107 stop:289 length:183 start_codon:yes stop_codon:yes gene_type:complete